MGRRRAIDIPRRPVLAASLGTAANYRNEFECPFWKREGDTASQTGHGGGDYFVMREFFRAIQEDREPPIDVYDGVTWSAVLPLSGRSIREGNKALEFPDFTRGKWRTRKLDGFGIDRAHSVAGTGN